jgi:tetratricopeptide (TPR) repeat protein
MRTRHFISALILLFCLTAFYFLSNRLLSQLLYLKAINHIRDGNYDTAVIHLEKAARKQPKDPLIWKELGKAYRNLAKPTISRESFDLAKKSEHAYRQATLLNPLDATAFYGLAQETAKLEQLNTYLNPSDDSGTYDALPFFQKAVQLRPNGIRYHYALAYYLFQKKKDQELIQAITHLVRIYPGAYRNLKREVFWSPQLNQSAKKGMQQAINEGVDPRNTQMILSSLLAEEKDWTGAITRYQKALGHKSANNTSANYFHLGRLYLNNGQLEEAEERFNKAFALSRNREKDLETLYQIYRANGYFKELHGFLLRIRDNFEFSHRIDSLLARNLIDQKKYQEARQVLIDLNQKEPSAENYAWLTRLAEIEKDWDSAELAIQKATVMDPANSQYHLKFSQILTRVNKLERAEKAAGQAIRHTARPSAGLFAHRASIRQQLNDFAGAAKDWEAAMNLDPKNAHYRKKYNEMKLLQKNK